MTDSMIKYAVDPEINGVMHIPQKGQQNAGSTAFQGNHSRGLTTRSGTPVFKHFCIISHVSRNVKLRFHQVFDDSGRAVILFIPYLPLFFKRYLTHSASYNALSKSFIPDHYFSLEGQPDGDF